jgi:hypothetical protein
MTCWPCWPWWCTWKFRCLMCNLTEAIDHLTYLFCIEFDVWPPSLYWCTPGPSVCSYVCFCHLCTYPPLRWALALFANRAALPKICHPFSRGTWLQKGKCSQPLYILQLFQLHKSKNMSMLQGKSVTLMTCITSFSRSVLSSQFFL